MAALGLTLAPLLVGLTLQRRPLTPIRRALALVLLGGSSALLALRRALALLRALVPFVLLGDHGVASSPLFALLGLPAVSCALLGLGLLSSLSRTSLGLCPLLSRVISSFDGVLRRGASSIAGRGRRMARDRGGAPLVLVNHDPLRHDARLHDDPRRIRSWPAVPPIIVDHPIVAAAVVGVRCVGVTDDPNVPLDGDESRRWRSRYARPCGSGTGRAAAGNQSHQQGEARTSARHADDAIQSHFAPPSPQPRCIRHARRFAIMTRGIGAESTPRGRAPLSQVWPACPQSVATARAA
jgi:hypothetical protein